jgi:hypothetical protein
MGQSAETPTTKRGIPDAHRVGPSFTMNLALPATLRLAPTSAPVRSDRGTYRNFDTRSASSRINLALSAAAVPVGSPL